MIIDTATADRVRDLANQVCTDHEAARAEWLKIAADSRCHGKTKRAARYAMLKVIADGGSIKDAANAGWAVLA